VEDENMLRRSLNELELEEVKLVFADALEYERIQVVEDDGFALRVEVIGSRFARRRPGNTNAVTLGNIVRFSRWLKTQPGNPVDVYLGDMGWMIHELTHAWQYQHFGLIYLPQAIGAHLTLGAKAYEYSAKAALSARGEDLKAEWENNKRFHDFNREQQGDITRDYYIAHKKELDTSGWLPFIEEVRSIES
jgi:hypothetical protein